MSKKLTVGFKYGTQIVVLAYLWDAMSPISKQALFKFGLGGGLQEWRCLKDKKLRLDEVKPRLWGHLIVEFQCLGLLEW